MKTLRNLMLAAFILAAFNVSAQWWGPIGPDIFNTNPGNVSIGTPGFAPLYTLDVNQLAVEPTIAIRNTGSIGGAAFRMVDLNSGADWKFKAIQTGGFKIRDVAYGLDVITIQKNSAAHCIYVGINDVVGFGTNTPAIKYGNKIDVRGDIACEDANAWVEVNNTLASSNAGINFSEAGVYKGWFQYSGANGYLRFSCDAGGWANHLVIRPTGEVGIGTATTKTGYTLSVAGKVACEEVLVESSTSWPDYVFDKDYELMNLEQLEKSIEKNNHLPGLPTAAEIEENGFSLGEMQKIVLEKVEELTLYTIEQGKQIEELKKENAKLKKLIENK